MLLGKPKKAFIKQRIYGFIDIFNFYRTAMILSWSRHGSRDQGIKGSRDQGIKGDRVIR